MPIQYETVAIPVARGIDVTTKARLVDPRTLLEAENSRFSWLGSQKRRGHNARRVRGAKTIPVDEALPTYDSTDSRIPADWLLGWGPIIDDTRTDAATLYGTSPHPDAGVLFGAATRDDETLFWNGHQLFSRTPGQPEGSPFAVFGPAMFPTVHAEPVAKVPTAQYQPCMADTETVRCVTWLDAVAGIAYYTVLDRTTGATIVQPTSLGIADCYIVKCIPVGDWVHILVSESDGETLQMRSFHSLYPSSLTARSLGPCIEYFDAVKVTNTEWVAAIKSANAQITVVWMDADGSTSATPGVIPDIDNKPVNTLAIAVHPTTEDFALVWRCNDITNGGVKVVYARVFTKTGTALAPIVTLGTVVVMDRPVAVASKYIKDEAGNPIFDAYWDDNDAAVGWQSHVARFYNTILLEERRKWTLLASQAFRVGDRTFIWGANKSDLQSTWLLLDESLLPVARLNFAIANVLDVSAIPFQTFVNWGADTTIKDIKDYHCALSYKLRVQVDAPNTGNNAPAVFAEPTIQAVSMDFLPNLRSAQAGRTTYFAGGQLWAYDGREIVESGFHIAPEPEVYETPLTQSNGGALTATGVYRWRVDLCHRNARNEEIRSHSFYTPEITLTGTNQTVTIKVPTCITRRTDSYFLFFRNENAGSQWYLCNSRDPDSPLYVENDPDSFFAEFADSGQAVDSALASREPHPGNGGFGYLEPFSAPSCEVIASGPDRLWLAGGEIPTGQIYPSRLFQPNETPSFNAYLAQQIDRGAEPITAVGFVGEIVVVFHENSTYLLEGFGPDNSSQGAFAPARLAYADVGAQSQESLALISQGLAFQSNAGIRLVSPGGGIQDIGGPVDSLAIDMDIAGTIVMPIDQEIRWYARSGDALVFNYEHGAWSTWTVSGEGVARNPVTGLALIASHDGYVWEETEDLWLDNGTPYRHRVRFAWMRAGDLMDFQRVRRIGALGEADPAESHKVHVDVYYDERAHAHEWFDWEYPQDAADPGASWNTDTFGSESFGDGAFGDNEA